MTRTTGSGPSTSGGRSSPREPRGVTGNLSRAAGTHSAANAARRRPPRRRRHRSRRLPRVRPPGHARAGPRRGPLRSRPERRGPDSSSCSTARLRARARVHRAAREPRTRPSTRSRSASPRTPDELRAAEDETLAAMRRGDDVIFQATFFDGRWRGHADFLLRRDDRPVGPRRLELRRRGHEARPARQGRRRSSRCASTRTCSSGSRASRRRPSRRHRRPRHPSAPARRLRRVLPAGEGALRGARVRSGRDGSRRRPTRSPSTTAGSARGGPTASTGAGPTTICRSSPA